MKPEENTDIFRP